MSDLRKYDPSLLDRANTAIDPSQYGRGSIGRFGANLAQNALDLLGLSDANYTPHKSGFNAEDMKAFAMNSIDVPEAKAVKNVAKRIMTPEIKAKNLERFLEGSKVREPVYHSSNNPSFSVFDPSKGISATGARDSKNATYFTTNSEFASGFNTDQNTYEMAKDLRDYINENSKTITTRERRELFDLYQNLNQGSSATKEDLKKLSELGIKNNGYFQGQGIYKAHLSMKNPLVIDYKGSLWDEARQSKEMKLARDDGYDGVIFKNIDEGSGPIDDYAVFDSKQIKSATGNRGTFDPTDPNILHSIAPISLARYNTQKEE